MGTVRYIYMLLFAGQHGAAVICEAIVARDKNISAVMTRLDSLLCENARTERACVCVYAQASQM